MSQSQDFQTIQKKFRRSKVGEDDKGSSKVASVKRISTAQPGTSTGKSVTSFIQSALSNRSGDGVRLMTASGGDGVRVVEGVRQVSASTGKKTGRTESARKRRKISSTSRARKKLKLDSNAWEKLMAVNWPGLEGDDDKRKTQDSDIQTSSDESVNSPNETDRFENQSDEIYDDNDIDIASNLETSFTKKRRKDRHHGKALSDRLSLYTSTPLQSKPRNETLAEGIADFDSSSSGGNATPPLTHSPPHIFTSFTPSLAPLHKHATVVASLKKKKKLTPSSSSSNHSFHSFNLSSYRGDYTSITTPPSSPELQCTDKLLSSRTKASEWIKQVKLDSLDSTRADERGLNETVLSKYQPDSAKKGRGRKIIAGGMAERLQKVVQHTTSEITFWEHRAKKMKEKEIVSSCLTVHVLVLSSHCSLLLAQCRILQGSLVSQPLPRPLTTASTIRESRPDVVSSSYISLASSQIQDLNSGSTTTGRDLHAGTAECFQTAVSLCEGGDGVRGVSCEGGDGVTGEKEYRGREICVLFSVRCAKYLNLRAGDHIQIHPPWQCLSLPSLGSHAVLCTHFSQCVGHSLPPPVAPSSSSTTTQLASSSKPWLLCVSTPGRSPSLLPARTMLTRSPARRLMPTKLFAEDSAANVTTDCDADITSKFETTTVGALRRISTRAPRTLAEAVRKAEGNVISFTARVLRVYQRRVACSSSLLSAGNDNSEQSSPPSLYQSLLQKACERRNLEHETRWAVLLCDGSGMFAEVQITGFERNDDGISNCGYSGLISHGEGRVHSFSNMRVKYKTSSVRNPELFSLISYLCGIVGVADHAPQSCYILVCQSNSQILSCDESTVPIPSIPLATTVPDLQETDLSQHTHYQLLTTDYDNELETTQRDPLLHKAAGSFSITNLYLPTPSFTRGGRSQGLDNDEEAGMLESCSLSIQSSSKCRVSFLARVLHTRSNSLFVVATTASNRQETVKLVLKPNFPVEPEGLKHYLHQPGARVLLRDVVAKRRMGFSSKFSSVDDQGRNDVVASGDQAVSSGYRYTMDGCSLVVPVPFHAVDLELGVYPNIELPPDGYQILDSLLPPPELPQLSSVLQSLNMDGDGSRLGAGCEGGARCEGGAECQDGARCEGGDGGAGCEGGWLVSVAGSISGVDEDSAYSWPTCDVCGNETLDTIQKNTAGADDLFCVVCDRSVASPVVSMQLAVFLRCVDLPTHTISVQLLQSTIQAILPVSSASIEQKFEVKSILGRDISLRACYCHSVQNTPDGICTVTLEEFDVKFPPV